MVKVESYRRRLCLADFSPFSPAYLGHALRTLVSRTIVAILLLAAALESPWSRKWGRPGRDAIVIDLCLLTGVAATSVTPCGSFDFELVPVI